MNLSVERGRKGAATYHAVWERANVLATRSTSRHYLLCTGPIFVLRFMCSSHTPVSKPLVYLRTFRFIALIVLCELDCAMNIYGVAKHFSFLRLNILLFERIYNRPFYTTINNCLTILHILSCYGKHSFR